MGLEYLDLALTIEKKIQAGIHGRIASDGVNSAIMASFAAIPGDHLEIGSLHGGTAILVALLKKELRLPGMVVCVDPLDGYYVGNKTLEYPVDPDSGVPVSMDIFQENVNHFEVADRIEIIQKRSDPFPVNSGRRFSTAYIDGDHWGYAPQKDWNNVNGLVDRYIIFDNCDLAHPSVLDACLQAVFTEDWIRCYKNGITCVFERF